MKPTLLTGIAAVALAAYGVYDYAAPPAVAGPLSSADIPGTDDLAKIPEDAAKIPEDQAKEPENSAKDPISAAKIPEESAKNPDDLGTPID